TTVGLCLSRGLDTLVATLAVLKAGAAYLPMDPAYPLERLCDMAGDSGAALLLVHRDTVLATREATPQCVLDSDPVQAELTGCADTDPSPLPGQGAREVAYVIYTSGSTGRPKGAAIEHRSAANLALRMIQRCEVGAGSRVLQFASQSFDAAVLDWTMALLSGATLYICGNDERGSVEKLQDYMLDNRITHAVLPPSLLSLLDSTRDYALRMLMVGGEACDPRTAQIWSSRYRLFNGYGPTEAAVCSTLMELKPDEPVTIGRPLGNVRAYVLDRQRQPVPLGAYGELYIGGVGVGRGYLNRPELTAERFIADPFVEDPQARLYATGDIVRYLADGRIEYVGRLDDQVKIRGFRIELGEIEARLLELAEVKAALVVVREDGRGERRLVAYVVPTAMDAALGDWREQLRRWLPEHMVPTALVTLAEFPMSVNGKVNRGALPAPELPGSGEDFVAPQGETQEALAEIWGRLLGLEVAEISAGASFFELGGHSLLSTRLVSAIRERFDVEL
ncbi:amino acid adenylation domain-containing protein, partial [Lysobacter maris]